MSSIATWPHLANTGAVVTKNGQEIWRGVLNGAGQTSASEPYWGTACAGLAYDVDVEYPSPIDGENGQMRPLMIIRAWLRVEQSGEFSCDGYRVGGLMVESAEDALPPLWSDVRECWVSGFGYERTLKINQDICAPLTIRAVTMEVKA
jgi:hypothetical protein